MSQRRIKLLALAMAVGLSLTAGVSAEDLKPHNNELTSIFNGSSFAVLVPENGKLQPAYADLLSLVKPYEKTRLSPKELGALASKIENAMRQMGYTGTIIKIVKAEGGRPLAMSVTYDLNAVKNPKVNREEIIKGLQVAMNEQFKTTANDQQKEPASLKALAEAAPSLKSMAEAEDQRQWVLSTAKSYVEGQVNSTLNTAIGAMVSGANSQITLGYDDEERDMKLSGKVLIPIISDPTYTFFTQTGLTEGDNDRTLFHAGLGLRFYPEAVDFENAGSYMFGINTVYDYDLSRYHRRFSLGGELGYETLSLYGNVYQRLSGWRTSPDFDSGLVEERPANGFDVGAKYALPSYLPLSFKGSYAQWFGEKVSPWGDTDPNNLMNDPHIWSIGLEWTPVPALGLSLTHEIEEGGDTNTEAMLSFNIPLSNAIEDAFNPEMGGVQNTIAGSRNAFIERDYSMPLEYRSKPGKFIISQCGLDAENNNYCFHIQDGFEKPVQGQTVTVVPSDKCVIMSQGGSYITDSNGNIHAAVDSSCVNHTVVDVGAGSTNKEFPIEIGNIAINYAITPPMMELTSDESGVFTLDGGPDAIQIPVKWSLIEGQGKLKDEQTETNSKGQATVTYVADEDTLFDYEATVVATVAGKDFPAFVNVKAAALTMTVPPSTEDDKYTVIVEGGAPNGEFTAQTQGPGQVIVPEGGLKFDENGKAEIEIQVQSPAEGTVTVTVTDNTSGKQGNGDTVLDLELYEPEIDQVSPSYGDDGKTVKANEAFEVTVSGLLPGSEVIYRETNGVKPAEGSTVTVKAGEDGTAVLKYQAITDPNISSFVPDLDYARDLADANDNGNLTHWDNAPEINIHQYALAVDAPTSTENGTYEVTVTGGKPGEEVSFDIQGHGTLDKDKAVFDEKGEAVVTVTVTLPAEGNITVTASSNGHSAQDLTRIDLVDYEATADIDYPSFTPAGNTIQDKTVDFNRPFVIHAKGLLPNSSINVTSDGYGVPSGMTQGLINITVDEKGECDIPYEAIKNPTIKDFTVVYQYAINEADLIDQGQFNGAFVSDKIKVWQYDLTISAPEAADDGKNFDITVSGGQPGENVDAELGEDQGEITCDQTFNEQGMAQCTINPDDGYDGPIEITVDSPNGEPGHASTDAGLVDYTSVNIEYPSFTPINQSRKENTVEFNKVFSIPVHGLLPNSTISVKPYNAGVFTVTPVSSEVTANENGDAVIDYQAITTVIDSFKVEFGYYLNLADQANDNYSQTFSSEDISVFAYQPEITAVETLTGDDHTFQVLVNGGSPNSQIKWEITGDGEFSTKDATFDANGNADAVIGVIPPGVTQIEITATDLNSGLSDSHITTLNLNAYGASLIPPVYDKGGIREENTVDIEEQFELVVEGLKPGTTATVTGSGVFPADGETSSYQVGEDGRITIPYDAITNGTAQELGLKIEYVKNSSGQTEVYETTVKIHNYILKIDGPAAADNGLPYDIEISGGRPNGTYTATVDHGDVYCQRSKSSNSRMARATTRQYSFNDVGGAFCTITPESGWAGNITVTVTGSGDTEQKVTNSNLMTYRPTIEYASSSSIDGVNGRYDYNEPFVVYVTGLLDGSQVQIDGLPSGVTVKNKNLTANGGRAAIEFNAVTTASSFTFDVKYFKTKADAATNTYSTIENTSMNMKEYNIKFSADSQTDLDGTMPSNIYLEGGKEGESIKWTIAGDGSITPATGYFNGSGKATATVTGKGTMTNAVTVTATTMGKTIRLSMNFVNYGLRFTSLPTFTNVDAQTFRNTVDNNEKFEVQVNRARPGSVIKWSSSLATPDNATSNVASDGTSKMTFKPITNLDDTSVTVSAEYERNASARATATANLRLHQYDMVLDVGDGKIDSYSNPGEQVLDKQVINVSGGKPNHKAKITLSGSGTVEGAKTHTFTFDKHGEANLTIVSEASFANDIGVKITPVDKSFTNSTCNGKLGYSFDSWQQTPSFDTNSLKDPSISTARMIDVEENYTFVVNGVYPNTEVIWSTSDPSAKLATTTTKADKNGRATVTLNPVTDYDLEKFTLTAKVWSDPRTQKDLKAEINVKQYTITLASSKSTIDAYDGKGIANANLDVVTVNVKGGRSGSALQWSLTGDGQLDYNGKTAGSGTFNSKGEATIKVYAKKSFTKNPTLTVSGLGSTKTQALTYDLTTYSPTLTLPTYSGTGGTANVDYGKTYTVKLSGGMPGTTVTWKTANSIVPDKATSTVATDGTASMTFKAISDFDVTSGQVSATVNTNAIKTAAKTATLKLPAYPLSFSYADGNLDAYSKSTAKLDTETITLKGGKENMQVTVTVGGNATLVVNGKDASSQTITLNKSGQGVLTVRSKTPFTSAPTLKAAGPGNRAASGSLKYVLSKASMKVTLPTYSSTLYGTEANTADYGEDYDVTVSGLLPGTVITPVNYKNSSLKDAKAQTVGTNGTVVLHYNGVKTRDDVGVKFTYVTQGAKTATYQGTVGIHNYNLELSSSKTSIVADESFTATVSGGKPGETVTFTLTGDGVLSSGGKTTSATFNNKGQATINVAGSAPYNSSIKIAAVGLGNNISNQVSVFNLTVTSEIKTNGMEEGAGGVLVYVNTAPNTKITAKEVYNYITIHVAFGTPGNWTRWHNDASTGHEQTVEVTTDGNGEFTFAFSSCAPNGHAEYLNIDFYVTVGSVTKHVHLLRPKGTWAGEGRPN